mgnify:FL=1
MKEYNFKEIEKKWQDRWADEPNFKAVDFHPTKPKFYILYEFYNISGNLHMGHLKGTVPADALARYKRLKGYNVLFPIGGDAFGLPAENAAIKKGINPFDFVANGMNTVLTQSKALGLSFDWDRTICTSDPSYFKWTQWIFLQLLKNDMAYKKKGFVNFCPNCKTVLSNEDSQGGHCDRCGGEVIQKERWVWYLKMRSYAEKLLDNVDKIQMVDSLKEEQRNWIGKSEGVQVAFDLVDADGTKLDKVNIFTTCIETIYGASFVVLAPEHDFVAKYRGKIENKNEIDAYLDEVAHKTEFERASNLKNKTGCVVKGLYAINPANGAKIPICISDFVLVNYGDGAVMAVACHDQRDFELADVLGLEKLQVIEGDCTKQAVEKDVYMKENRKLINSAEFSGMGAVEAHEKIAEKLIAEGKAKKVINYRMQDWSFNRQRYWGEPFPVVFCEHCGVVPLDEKDLPVMLPKTDDYLPNDSGDSPLAKVESFVKTTCPKCGGVARRETDTMPNWAGSSWYWLRYIDPHNDNALADRKKLEYWGSVDCYTGGTEHITRHVLYAFFWQNFLYDIGVVPTREPFKRKMGSGLVLDSEGKKMSKSSANGVSPLEVIDKYGADVARLHVHFLGGYEDDTPWTYDGINGVTTFINRVWNLPDIMIDGDVSKEHIYLINRLVKKVGDDLEDLKLNTSIAACMSFVKQIRADGFITKEEFRRFLIVLNPIAPHITSELYEMFFGGSIANETWPKYDEKYLIEDTIDLPVQVNGKMKITIKVSQNATQEEVMAVLKENMSKINTPSNEIKKVIYVPNRILNLIY